MSKRTQPVGVLDAETDPFKANRVPVPFLWGFYNGEQYHQWERTKDVIAFLQEYDGIVYAHNGGKFDYHFLLHGLEEFAELSIINSRLAKMNIGLCELRDSFNILPVPLSAYKKDEIDYAIFEADERIKPANFRKIAQYLKSDCVYLWDFVTQFIERFGLHLTHPGASLAQWQEICGVKPPRTDAAFYEEFSPYYYGGRVECFESGIIDTAFSVYDINSAYPRAMMDKHPYSENYERSGRYLKNADFVKVWCVSDGAFPWRGDGNPGMAAGLRFPNDGEPREYTVTGWEYRAAKDAGALHGAKVLESVRFCTHVDFRQFIEHFYALRMQAKAANDAAGVVYYKLMMNGLYGKMAANPDNYKNYMVVPPAYAVSLPGTGWEFGGELGPWALAQAPLAEEQKRYYNIATGASITGWVRAYLWQAMRASTGVLYCDTDSIAVRKAGALALGDELGQWKHEGDFDRAGIGGKKLYIMRGVPGSEPDPKKSKDGRAYKTAAKGARLTHAQLWQVAAGEVVEYVPDAPTFSPRTVPHFVSRDIRKTA